MKVLGLNKSGALLENAVCNALAPLGELRFWARRNGQEIDFILDGERAFEVKYSPSASEQKALQKRANSLGINNAQLIGAEPLPDGFQEFLWAGTLGWEG